MRCPFCNCTIELYCYGGDHTARFKTNDTWFLTKLFPPNEMGRRTGVYIRQSTDDIKVGTSFGTIDQWGNVSRIWIKNNIIKVSEAVAYLNKIVKLKAFI
jgi:hypothetical protein